SALKLTSRWNAPRRSSMSASIIFVHARSAPGHPLRGRESDDGKQDREDGQSQRLRVTARHLRERVDRKRQRLGLSRNVGDKGDGRAELAEGARERPGRPCDDAG